MTTTANIQTDGNTAIQITNKIMGDGTMNHGNDNINLANRLSHLFGMGAISKFVAGAALGLALTIGLAMPGAARADIPSIPGSSSNLFDNLNDDFSMVYGIPDNGPGSGGAITSAPARVKVNTGSTLWNDDFSMVYGIPDSGLKLGGDNAASATAKVRGSFRLDSIDDDEWVFGSPYIELNPGS